METYGSMPRCCICSDAVVPDTVAHQFVVDALVVVVVAVLVVAAVVVVAVALAIAVIDRTV